MADEKEHKGESDDASTQVTSIKLSVPEPTIKHKSLFLPQGYLRCLVVGGSGQGKTVTTIIDLLPMLHEFKLIIVYVSNPYQPVLKDLAKWCKAKNIEFKLISGSPSEEMLEGNSERFAEAKHSVVLFDDLDDMKPCIPFFKRGRNLHLSTILCTQRLHDVPLGIRINLNLLLLFKSFDSYLTIYMSLPKHMFESRGGYKYFKHIMSEVDTDAQDNHTFLTIAPTHDPIFRVQRKFGGVLENAYDEWKSDSK